MIVFAQSSEKYFAHFEIASINEAVSRQICAEFGLDFVSFKERPEGEIGGALFSITGELKFSEEVFTYKIKVFEVTLIQISETYP